MSCIGLSQKCSCINSCTPYAFHKATAPFYYVNSNPQENMEQARGCGENGEEDRAAETGRLCAGHDFDCKVIMKLFTGFTRDCFRSCAVPWHGQEPPLAIELVNGDEVVWKCVVRVKRCTLDCVDLE